MSLMQFSKIESSYTSKDGCRLVWKGVEEDDLETIILNKKELEQLIDLLKGTQLVRLSLRIKLVV